MAVSQSRIERYGFLTRASSPTYLHGVGSGDLHCPVPKCEAPGAPISVEEHTAMAPRPAAKVRILRFKTLPPFRHYRGLQNHV